MFKVLGILLCSCPLGTLDGTVTVQSNNMSLDLWFSLVMEKVREMKGKFLHARRAFASYDGRVDTAMPKSTTLLRIVSKLVFFAHKD